MYNVEYAISLGIEQREGLWKMQFMHPLDAMSKQTVWMALSPTDKRIGKRIEGIQVAKCGPRMQELLTWLHDKVRRYPYYWPYEGRWVDRYGHDFHVRMNPAQNNSVAEVELSLIAYEIIKNNFGIRTPEAGNQIVDQETILLPKGGAYIKYTVTLDRAKPVSEISIAPFTEYAIELISATYEEDIETFHPRKELIPHEIIQEGGGRGQKPIYRLFRADKDAKASTRAIQLKFPAIIVRRFTFILRQKNYKKNTYLIRAKDINKKDLWNKISQREAEVTLDLTDGLSTVEDSKIQAWTGWDIYLQQMQKHKDAHAKWKKDMQDYRQRQQLINQREREKKQAEAAHKKAMDAYRSEYKKALEKYNRQVQKYKRDLETYNTAKAKYERDLTLYNQYLRDLKNWQSKWG